MHASHATTASREYIATTGVRNGTELRADTCATSVYFGPPTTGLPSVITLMNEIGILTGRFAGEIAAEAPADQPHRARRLGRGRLETRYDSRKQLAAISHRK